MKLILFFTLILIISCSSGQRSDVGYEYDEEKNIDLPIWIYSVNDDCDTRKNLCASAEGDSSETADLNAKKALASIMEVKITSKTQISRFGLTSIESEGLTEKVSSNLNEEINTVLKGVQILKRFKKEKSFYSYAVLEKEPALKILKTKLDKIDDKIESLYKEQKRVYVNRLLTLLSERDALYAEILLLSGQAKKSAVSYSQIYDMKRLNSAQEVISLVNMSDIPSNLQERVEEEFTAMGFQISAKSPQSLIKIEFLENEEYLKVKGFKKYSFVLNLTSFDTQDKKLGVVTIKQTATGRSREDALRSILNKLIMDVKSNIQKLNI